MAEQRSSRPGFVREVLQIGLPLVILAAGGAAYWLLSRPIEAPARQVEEDEAPLVSTVPAQAHDGGLEIRVDGAVVPYREIELSAEIDGRVEFKADVCRAGSYVTRNTLLLKIDPRDYELERDRLGKEVEQAAGDCDELEAEIKNTEEYLIPLAQEQLDLQEADFKRQEELHGRRIASDSDLGQASLNRLQAANALETLDSQLRVLRKRRGRLTAAKEHAAVLLEKAELDLERTELYSPDDADGVIVSDLVEKGDYVRKGTPLVTFEDTSKVEVKCNLRVDELYWLWNEMGGTLEDESNVSGAAYQVPQASAAVVYRIEDQAYEWTGVLSRYDGIGMDEATRTVPCRVVVDDPRKGCVREGDELLCRETRPPALVRGMYVTVKIHAEPQAKLVRVPEAAVRPGNKVWVVRDGKLAILDVHVVQTADDTVIVLAGPLKDGDPVVVTPLAEVQQGMAVTEQIDR